MNFLFDFFPLLLFFIAYKLYGIYVATAVAISASFVQVAVHWIKHKKFNRMHVITFAILVFFGGATLVFRDDMFIKWKPSILYWLFAAVFLGSQFIGNKPIVKRIMPSHVILPDLVWLRLNISWVAVFVFLGFLNIWVVYNFDTDTWVNFKFYGITGITLGFAVIQAFYMARYLKTIPVVNDNSTGKE